MAATAENGNEKILEGYRERRHKACAAMLVKMAKYLPLADGHCNTDSTDLWLYFNELDKLMTASKVLKAEGYRSLEAFKSPADAPEQLAYTMIVNLHEKAWSDAAQNLVGILSGMQVNHVSVFDMHDGSFIVTLDEQSNMVQWGKFMLLHAKALKIENSKGGISKRGSIYSNPIELTKSFTVDFAGKG